MLDQIEQAKLLVEVNKQICSSAVQTGQVSLCPNSSIKRERSQMTKFSGFCLYGKKLCHCALDVAFVLNQFLLTYNHFTASSITITVLDYIFLLFYSCERAAKNPQTNTIWRRKTKQFAFFCIYQVLASTQGMLSFSFG